MKFKYYMYLLLIFIMPTSCDSDYIMNAKYEDYGVSYENHLRFKTTALVFSVFMTFNDWKDSQSGVIYGDMLLNVLACDEEDDDEENAFLWDLNTGKKLGSFNLSHILDGSEYYKPHANEVCFGKKINDDDLFPLLYISQSFGLEYGKIEHKKSGVLVYRIINSDKKYKAELVQVIKPSIEDEVLFNMMGSSIHNYVVDTDNDLLYVLGYRDNSWFNSNNDILVTIFKLPKLSEGKELVLTHDMILDNYTIPMSYCMQSAFYDNGFIYIMNGDEINFKWIRSLNLKSKKIESKLDFSDIAGEPQFCGYWKGKFLLYFAGDWGNLFEIRE